MTDSISMPSAGSFVSGRLGASAGRRREADPPGR
jgi:hypothetical protein